MPGPVPKRESQRRRVNKPAVPTDHADGAPVVERPGPAPQWHPVAKRWFVALGESGQAVFYEPSDWATAFLIAESISRELSPQRVVVGGQVHRFSMPPKPASLAAWLKGMSSLMVTEGDRRRLRLELERPDAPAGEEAGDVSWIDDARSRLRGSG